MPRSTRSKVRWQIEKAADQLTRCMEHLARADAMAAGRSTPIENYLPQLVVMLEEVRKVLLGFRAEL